MKDEKRDTETERERERNVVLVAYEIGKTLKDRTDRNFAQIRALSIFPRIVPSAFSDTGNLLIPTIHRRVPRRLACLGGILKPQSSVQPKLYLRYYPPSSIRPRWLVYELETWKMMRVPFPIILHFYPNVCVREREREREREHEKKKQITVCNFISAHTSFLARLYTKVGSWL